MAEMPSPEAMKKRREAAAQYALMRDRPMSVADFAPEEEPPGVFAPESIEGPKIYDALRQGSLTPKGAPSATAAVAQELIGGPVAQTVGKVVKAAPLVGAAAEGLGSMAGRAKELVKGALKGKADEVVEGAATAGAKKADEAADAAKQWQEKGVESPYFKRWFGDSKAVDEGGKPMVVYHGTSRPNVSQFETDETPYGLMGTGAYFTESPLVASGYAARSAEQALRRGEKPASNVLPVYLSIKNPLDMDAPADVSRWIGALKKTPSAKNALKDLETLGTTPPRSRRVRQGSNEAAFKAVEQALADAGLSRAESAATARAVIKEMGFDGITHTGGASAAWATGKQMLDQRNLKHRVYVAFEPEQIKSATGNVGTFNPKDPRIAYGVGAGAVAEQVRKDDE